MARARRYGTRRKSYRRRVVYKRRGTRARVYRRRVVRRRYKKRRIYRKRRSFRRRKSTLATVGTRIARSILKRGATPAVAKRAVTHLNALKNRAARFEGKITRALVKCAATPRCAGKCHSANPYTGGVAISNGGSAAMQLTDMDVGIARHNLMKRARTDESTSA